MIECKEPKVLSPLHRGTARGPFSFACSFNVPPNWPRPSELRVMSFGPGCASKERNGINQISGLDRFGHKHLKTSPK